MTYLPRNEYPRPDFVRENWLSLNGEWKFSFEEKTFDKIIVVPFACESKLSGIGENGFHHTVWYKKEFSVPSSMSDKNIILHFGAVDYFCRVWVNDILVTEHIGGQTSFFTDITDAVDNKQVSTIVLQVVDDYSDFEMPRGKQFWEKESRSIFYTRTTGIWQSVWIEGVSPIRLSSVKITPLFDDKAVKFDYVLCGGSNISLETRITFRGVCAVNLSAESQSRKGSYTISLSQPALKAWNFYEDFTWTPENPRLFDVEFHVYKNGVLEDTVTSYFGIRKVSIENGMFFLNNRPYYQKLVLDQGYWKDSLLTAPTDDDFIKDIQMVKDMGFNGVRKHQKIEDPRFLYHADRMGLLVWGEIGSAYLYSREYAVNMYKEWADAIMRDYNHPCIVVWTPLNESWGIQEIKTSAVQQAHCNTLYYMTKSLDDTRPVVDNDGWEHTCSDILTVHDYEPSQEIMKNRYESLENILNFYPNGKSLYANGWSYHGQPIMVSEFGGIRFSVGNSQKESWGYSEEHSQDEFLRHYYRLVDTLLGSSHINGFCYTQLTDIETEENGLLTCDRIPKVPLEIIKKINMGEWAEEKI